eukprot:4997179-Prymnesium_polylepis.1
MQCSIREVSRSHNFPDRNSHKVIMLLTHWGGEMPRLGSALVSSFAGRMPHLRAGRYEEVCVCGGCEEHETMRSADGLQRCACGTAMSHCVRKSHCDARRRPGDHESWSVLDHRVPETRLFLQHKRCIKCAKPDLRASASAEA